MNTKLLAITCCSLLASLPVYAIDIPIKITGTIHIPPCVVNKGNKLDVDFGDISVTDVSNIRNHKKIDVPIECSYYQGDAYVKIIGNQLGSEQHILKTNIKNLGIALYQGNSTLTKLVLGGGKNTGNINLGYQITEGLAQKNTQNSLFSFTAVPFKQGVGDLPTGNFNATMSLSISYF